MLFRRRFARLFFVQTVSSSRRDRKQKNALHQKVHVGFLEYS